MEGFRKMDEMEMTVNLKAVKSAWLFGILFLLVWIGYDRLKTDTYNGIAFILMTSQLIIYWTVTLFLKWKLGKDEK